MSSALAQVRNVSDTALVGRRNFRAEESRSVPEGASFHIRNAGKLGPSAAVKCRALLSGRA